MGRSVDPVLRDSFDRTRNVQVDVDLVFALLRVSRDPLILAQSSFSVLFGRILPLQRLVLALLPEMWRHVRLRFKLAPCDFCDIFQLRLRIGFVPIALLGRVGLFDQHRARKSLLTHRELGAGLIAPALYVFIHLLRPLLVGLYELLALLIHLFFSLLLAARKQMPLLVVLLDKGVNRLLLPDFLRLSNHLDPLTALIFAICVYRFCI